MHHHIYIIYQHPVEVIISFMVERIFFTLFLYFILHIICNSPYLRLIACLANNKEISYCFIYFSQVKRNNVFPFFFLYSSNDGLDDF